MKSDIEIAQSFEPKPIEFIAGKLGLNPKHVELYGKVKAKISMQAVEPPAPPNGKLILVTAITPTPAGEGKTTTTVGLSDALSKLGKKTVVALREPSLGPVFGMKGGAAGGGYAQVIPMEDINLHFTGDFQAIAAANNLLAALIDNHIHRGNKLGINQSNITWRRCMDVNDRQLRIVTVGHGGSANGIVREDGFDITAASEVMAILCLASSFADLKQRLARIIIGYKTCGEPVYASQLKAEGAMTALLRDALMPNLVQTLEGTPALIHGGPFANIAHGCNTINATRLAMRYGDYAVTEAGFGADLGAEKFLDIKCRLAGIKPDAVVIVATVRALKYHAGVTKENLTQPDLAAVERGLPNLFQHVENITQVFGLPCVVAINQFPTDTAAETELVQNACEQRGINVALSQVWAKGGEGGIALAEQVVRLAQTPSSLSYCYDLDAPIVEKLETVAKRIYRAHGVELSSKAQAQAIKLTELGFDNLPICVAKTQFSFSDNSALHGTPHGFKITVRNLKVSAGAGFIVALTGDIMTMPGLPKVPAAESIDVDASGIISGLF